METISPAPLFEEQLDLTLRLLREYSVSLSPEELKSLRQRLAHMHHAVGHMLTLRSLESEGVAPLGNDDRYLSQPSGFTPPRFTDYLNLLEVDAIPSSVGDVSGLRTAPTGGSGNADGPANRHHIGGIYRDRYRDTPSPHDRRNSSLHRRSAPVRRGRGGVPLRRGRGSAPMRRGRGAASARVNRSSSPQGSV